MPGMEWFGAEERKEVNDVLETGVLFRYNHDAQRNGHWKARTFEQEIAQYTGAKYAHACSSGSAAVSILLAAAGVGYGDEVIVPPYTFVATIESVIFAGAVPVFAEIDETICLSPEGIKAAITPKTKAVLLVHMCGAIGRIDEIETICKEHNITLIEDSAQALGASFRGRMAGTIGKVGSYSMDFFKIISCGEGGVCVTNDADCYEVFHTYSDHGHNHQGNNRGMEGHPYMGFNYRIGEMNAAVGLAQLRKINDIIAKQKHNKALLKAGLAKHKQITFRHLPDPEGDSATFLSFFLPDEHTARTVWQEFGKVGVDNCNYWYDNQYHFIRNWEQIRDLKSPYNMPVHHLPHQDYNNLNLPKSHEVVGRLISMGVKLNWTDADIADRISKMDEVLDRVLNKVTV